jgi:uncharacterized membrane protein YccC
MPIDERVLAALISGASGLLGAVVGGSISWLSTRRLEARRWEREDSRRFEQQQRAAYVALLSSVAKLVSTPKEKLHVDSEVVAEWLTIQSEIEIIASEKVNQAARSFSMAVQDQLFNPHPQLPSGSWGEARRRLIQEIRQELGLTPSMSDSKVDA